MSATTVPSNQVLLKLSPFFDQLRSEETRVQLNIGKYFDALSFVSVEEIAK